MRTKRQKTIEGQHLSPVELERDRATALISVLPQWLEAIGVGTHRRTAWSAASFCAPLLASRRERLHLSAGDMPYGRRRFDEAIRSYRDPLSEFGCWRDFDASPGQGIIAAASILRFRKAVS